MVWLNSHHTVHSHGISLLHPIWPEFFLLTLGKPTISAGKSQFFIDFHGSQTVSNCQRDPEEKYRYIRISYPHFSCWTPHSSLKWLRKSGIPKNTKWSAGSWTSCGSSRASPLRTGPSRGFLAVVLIFVGADPRERKWWCFCGALKIRWCFCCVCFVDWRYWRWILKRFNHWHPLT